MYSVCIHYLEIRFDFYIGEEMYKTETPKTLLLFVKYEYEAKFGPCEELYDMTFDAEATIKYVRHKLNEPCICGELDMSQYCIYKHGEQHVRSGPMVDYYKYIEPV